MVVGANKFEKTTDTQTSIWTSQSTFNEVMTGRTATVAVVLLIFILGPCCASTPIALRPCDGDSSTSIDTSPTISNVKVEASIYPVQRGRDVTISITATIHKRITHASISVNAKTMGVTVLDQTIDACTYDVHQFTCPALPGQLRLRKTIRVSPLLLFSKVDVTVIVRDLQQRKLFCAKSTPEFISGSLSRNDNVDL